MNQNDRAKIHKQHNALMHLTRLENLFKFSNEYGLLIQQKFPNTMCNITCAPLPSQQDKLAQRILDIFVDHLNAAVADSIAACNAELDALSA